VTHMSRGPENRSTWMQRLLLCHGNKPVATPPHWETQSSCAVVVVLRCGLGDVCDVFNFGIDCDRTGRFHFVHTYRNVPTCTRFHYSRVVLVLHQSLYSAFSTNLTTLVLACWIARALVYEITCQIVRYSKTSSTLFFEVPADTRDDACWLE
jgi:hypothetical protein